MQQPKLPVGSDVEGPRPEVFAKKGHEAGSIRFKIRSQLGILHNTGKLDYILSFLKYVT